MLGGFVTLPNGRKFPQLGFGTAMGTYESVKEALKAGYRYIRVHLYLYQTLCFRSIDTAALYFNEDQVGKAIAESIAEGIVKREDIFVTTKLMMTSWDNVEFFCRKSLEKLKLEYVDLYSGFQTALLHFLRK